MRYTAGYILPWEATDEAPADLPADLEGLAQEMVQYIFGKLESGGSSGLKAFSISDVRWEWSDETLQLAGHHQSIQAGVAMSSVTRTRDEWTPLYERTKTELGAAGRVLKYMSASWAAQTANCFA